MKIKEMWKIIHVSVSWEYGICILRKFQDKVSCQNIVRDHTQNSDLENPLIMPLK